MLRLATFGVPAVLLAVLSLVPGSVSGAPRSYASGGFLLELEGVPAGRLAFAEGGTVTAPVITQGVGAERSVKKQLGPPRYEEITIECDPAGLAKPLQGWIQDAVTGKATRRSGAIVELDASQAEAGRLQFTNALITQVALPALDGSSKLPDRLTVRFQPQTTVSVAGKGTRPATPAPKGVKWLPSNFRLALDGLDTTRVSKVEPLVITQKIAQGQAAGLDVGNLVVSVSAIGAPSLIAWHDSFVLQGMNTDAREKKGTLTLLSPDLQQALLTIDLQNVGIFRLAAEPSEEGQKRYRADMYCEKVGFVFSP